LTIPSSSRHIRVGLLELPLLDRAGELLLDLRESVVERRLIRLANHDVPAGLGTDLRDAMPHEAAADDANLADLHQSRTLR
jgi:hypothetical protein